MSASQYLRYLICCMSMFLAVSAAFAQNESEDAARRYMVRGVAAIEMAKTESDLRAAADEFRRATEINPRLSGAWYNLAAVQAKLQDYAGAIASYKRYLEIEPSSEDAPKVRDEIIKLEYRLERTAKQQSLAGKWGGDSTIYTLTLKGNEFRMQSTQPANWNPWAEKSLTLYFKDMFGMLNERTPEKITANVTYEGRIDGDRITGERIRDAYDNEQSACRIPAHRAAFEGKVENDGNLITITFEDPHYRAEYSSVFFGMQNCINVSVDGTVKREVKYFRQKMLPVGIELSPAEKGGVRTVSSVIGNSSADWMGVAPGDQILAIDGQDISSLPNEEIRDRLQGEAGKAVSVRLNRSGWSKPVDLPLTCGVRYPGGKPWGNGVVGIEFKSELTSDQGIATWRHRIVNLVEGGPAKLAGLQIGGEIVGVGDQDARTKSRLDFVSLVRGEPGTQVVMVVRYPDGEEFEYTMIRKEAKAANPAAK